MALLLYNQAPIGRVPAEILRMIFWLLAGDDKPKHKYAQTNWIRLGHVCAVWRAVLLDMPTLWARDVLAFSTQGALDTVVARARQVPLHLICQFEARAVDLTEIANLLPRAETFNYGIRRLEEELSFLEMITSGPLPLLRNLCVVNYYGALAEETEPEPDQINILDDLTALHTLAMHRVYFNPPLNGLLVDLRIQYLRRSLPRPSLDDILNVMAHNAGLQFLSLRLALSEDTPAPTAILPVLVMHKLTELDIEVKAADIVDDFLAAVNTPALQTVYIETTYMSGRRAVRVYDVLAKALSACHLVSNTYPSSRLACVSVMTDKTLMFSVHRDSQKRGRPLVCFKVKFPDRDITSVDVVDATKSFRDAQVSDRVRELYVDDTCSQCDTEECWNVMFSAFKSTEKLVLPAWPRTNKPLRLLGSLDSSESLRLPLLHRVVCYGISGSKKTYEGARDFEPTLRQREQLGAPACSIEVSTHSRLPDVEYRLKMDEIAKKHKVKLTDYRCKNGYQKFVLDFAD